MNRKIFIPLHEGEVAPRFDLSMEVLIAQCDPDGRVIKEKVLIMPGPSAERLSHMIVTEHISTVICGGIDQEVYDYLTWKQIEVIDNVIGPSAWVVRRYVGNQLKSGDVLLPDCEEEP
jgi:predicted Fe-Mo cluster-binding NifX family protein